jgi:hypothetical protein
LPTADDLEQVDPPPFARDLARSEAVSRIGAVVRTHMDREQIKSVRALAKALGMSWKPIDKLLSGDPDPPLSTLLQLAHGLGLRSIEELLGPFETTRVLISAKPHQAPIASTD